MGGGQRHGCSFGRRTLKSNEKPIPLLSPSQPAFCYAGGKFHERKKIVEKMPPHKTYVEPFAGAANVLLAKPPAEREFLNDKNKSIMNVHKGVKKSASEWDMKPSRRKWKKFCKIPKNQRSAYQMAYVLEHSYGGKGEEHGYNNHGKEGKQDTSKMHERLKDVKMSSDDFAKVMRRADSKVTLHYLDPPYTPATTTEQYGDNQITPERVEDVADKMKGKVMISYDNSVAVKKAFGKKKWRIQKVKTAGGLAGKGHTDRTDILITNFDPKKERANAEEPPKELINPSS
jgi:DNA adenine methylase